MVQNTGKPRGVFDDFSIASVAASALTAATSFLLTSRIGLAGSLIGAVVAAVISTACTQVYKGMLSASADRIRVVAEPAAVGGRHTSVMQTYHGPSHDAGRLVQRLALFAAAISLVGVLASAAVILLATRGQGIGPTTWEPAQVTVQDEGASSQAQEGNEAVEATAAETTEEPKVEKAPEEAAANGAAPEKDATEEVTPDETAGTSEELAPQEQTQSQTQTVQEDQPLTP